MINTTTIPTQIYTSSLNAFFNITAVLSMAMLISVSMMELFLYRIREKERDELSGSESESEEEETAVTDKYTDKYCEEFAALALRELSDEDLTNLITKVVREQVVEKVEVIMTFDKSTNTFWYYTDNLKDVSYDILETVARKYAIEHDCKKICLTVAEDIPIIVPVDEEEQKKEEIAPSPSVFAKFKNYNTGTKGSMPNYVPSVKVIEQMNHFRYRGKLYEYEEAQKTGERKEEPILDYTSYKKLLEKKEK